MDQTVNPTRVMPSSPTWMSCGRVRIKSRIQVRLVHRTETERETHELGRERST